VSILRKSRTHDEQTDALARSLPSGKLWNAKWQTGTTTRDLLEGVAHEMVRIDEKLRELQREMLPDETELFLSEWESAVGIPDRYGCLTGVGTVAERRRDILVKLASLGVQTGADFVELAGIFGITVTTHGGAWYSDALYANPPTISFPDNRTARHTIVVEYGIDEGNVFPLPFPIPFGSTNLSLLECIFERVKPANCQVYFRRDET
jgi:uncharacterized protein YmfQ (DUF2313 family)